MASATFVEEFHIIGAKIQSRKGVVAMPTSVVTHRNTMLT